MGLVDDTCTLKYFYGKHKRGFTKDPSGVYVTGTGYEPANGFYVRRDRWEGPPSTFDDDDIRRYWKYNACQWYEKDDKNGWIIFRRSSRWVLLHPWTHGEWRSYGSENDPEPPAQGWR